MHIRFTLRRKALLWGVALVVAVMTLLAWMQANDAPLMDSNATVRSLDGQLISANAYLGGWGIAQALAAAAHQQAATERCAGEQETAAVQCGAHGGAHMGAHARAPCRACAASWMAARMRW